MRYLPVLALLGLAALAALALALATGPLAIGPLEALQALLGHGEPMRLEVVWELRLPRALSAFAVGALLALAGAQLQVLLQNPLADPYVLGISGGAAFGALAGLLLGLGGTALTGSAAVGAALSLALVAGLARGAGLWQPNRMLLTGIVLASGWGALVSLLLALAPQEGLRGMLFWLMGDLAHATNPYPALAVVAAGLVLSQPLARDLNVLARGELQAGALGVAVAPLRLHLLLLSSLMTATAVTLGGTVGFVGLVVPHMVRLTLGRDHRLLLPAAVLVGGTLLVLADTLARSVFAPRELPVGVITALLGVPLFLYLLQRSYRP